MAYAFQFTNRVYPFVLLCLCASLFSASALAISPHQIKNAQNSMDLIKRELINLGYDTTLQNAQSPVTASASGGEMTINNKSIVGNKKSGATSVAETAYKYGRDAVKGAYSMCMRNPTRCNLAGMAVGAGIYGLEQLFLDKGVTIDGDELYEEVYNYKYDSLDSLPSGYSYRYQADAQHNCRLSDSYCLDTYYYSSKRLIHYEYTQNSTVFFRYCLIEDSFIGSAGNTCVYLTNSSAAPAFKAENSTSEPVTETKIEELAELAPDYMNSADIDLIGGTLSFFDPIPFMGSIPDVTSPVKTTTKTNSNGETLVTETQQTTSFSFKGANSGQTGTSSNSGALESTVTTNQTTVNVSSGQVTESSQTTETDVGTATTTKPDTGTGTGTGTQPDTGTGTKPEEMPTGCDLFNPFCLWAEWTQQGIDEPEPDLAGLISEFEPDSDSYNSGIGAGSCPAPMSLYVHIINRTVEVSYQPFCDFLEMIRPLVIAGAWLLSAFMYIGVLRRG